MKPTQALHDLGQSLWVDNITRTMLDDGTLAGYIDELSVTGLTSNPTIFDKAIGDGYAYDEQVAELTEQGLEGEELFFELALTDLRRAAGLFKPVNERTDGVDGRVSLEVSPLLADDDQATIKQAAELYGRAEENFFIKIPGTIAGHKAIEETIFAGIPVNVTLLFSTEQYLGAADAYMRGIERRIEAGLNPDVRVGRLAVRQPLGRRGRRRGPGRAARTGSGSRSASRPMPPTASCSTPTGRCGSPTRARARSGCSGRAPAPRTPTPPTSSTSTAWPPRSRSTRCPRRRCKAFADHGTVGDPLPADGGDAEETLKAFNDAGIDTDAVGIKLQEDGKDSFNASWRELLETIAKQREAV